MSLNLSGPTRPVGLVVAVGEEAQAILTSLLPRTRGHLGRFPFWRGPMARREVAMVQCGPGLDRAREAARLLVERQNPRILLSVGMCGGLVPGQQTGDILVASKILTGGEPLVVDPRVLAVAQRVAVEFHELGRIPEKGTTIKGYRCAEAVLVSRDQVLTTAARKKAEAAASGAEAVDMESSAVAGVAEEAGIPWCAVRVISDTVHEDLPLDFNRFMDSSGQPQRLKIFMKGLLNPRLMARLMAMEKTTRDIGRVLVRFLDLLLPEMVRES